jgi:DNA-binding CsgD family transcriptional regulator
MLEMPFSLAIERIINAGRYELPLANAMALACGKLTESERHLLLWRYESGLSLREISELLRVNPSRVNLLLQHARHRLRDYVICCLSGEEGMSGCAIAECLQDMIENPYHAVSLLDCLKENGSKRKPPVPDHGLPAKLGLRLVNR